MLCADIMRQAGNISDIEWNFFLRGSAGVDKVQYILGSVVHMVRLQSDLCVLYVIVVVQSHCRSVQRSLTFHG